MKFHTRREQPLARRRDTSPLVEGDNPMEEVDNILSPSQRSHFSSYIHDTLHWLEQNPIFSGLFGDELFLASMASQITGETMLSADEWEEFGAKFLSYYVATSTPFTLQIAREKNILAKPNEIHNVEQQFRWLVEGFQAGRKTVAKDALLLAMQQPSEMGRIQALEVPEEYVEQVKQADCSNQDIDSLTQRLALWILFPGLRKKLILTVEQKRHLGKRQQGLVPNENFVKSFLLVLAAPDSTVSPEGKITLTPIQKKVQDVVPLPLRPTL